MTCSVARLQNLTANSWSSFHCRFVADTFPSLCTHFLTTFFGMFRSEIAEKFGDCLLPVNQLRKSFREPAVSVAHTVGSPINTLFVALRFSHLKVDFHLSRNS